VEFRILGPLEALDGDQRLPLPGGRGRALLALLILNVGKVVSTERLIDDLWGETVPPTVQTALQGLVSDLRKRLEPTRTKGEAPAVLRTAPPGYRLAVEPRRVDANRFRRLLEEARAGEAAERAATLREALGLWHGPALADFTYEPFAQREIATLEELRLEAIEQRVDADMAVGLESELVAELEAVVAEHPFRERLRGQLMLALYRTGRQADALEVYRDTRRTLVEELGIEPGAALRQLEQAILRQDPSLDLDPPAAQPVAAARLAEPAAERWLAGERRPVTVVFVDVAVPSIGDGVDPEALRVVVGRSIDLAAGVLGRHGASVEELVGDVLVGLFGVPAAHEDDALRAVRAVDEVRVALGELSEEVERDRGIRLPMRAGVETGEVVTGVPGSGNAPVSGDAVHAAARLQRAARHGEVLVGEATRRLLRECAVLEPLEIRPSDGPGASPAAWRLIDLVPGAPAVARRLDAPMVGRAAELGRLQAAFEGAVRRGAGYRFTVLGEAGIGKSRLASEFVAALGSRARVLTGHCLAYGEGITFRPLWEVVLEAAGGGGFDALSELLSGEADGRWIARQVAAGIGLTQEPTRAEDLFPAVRRFFEALSKRHPLVVVLEDVHWAEPTLLDLIEYAADAVRGPVLLVCLARPELAEERPAWGAGRRNVDTLLLEPLGSTEIQLIADRVAGGMLPAETRARVVETARGNPLFAQQMGAALQDEGAVSVPASVQALLAARLDRLGPAERDLLRSAAVVGTDFTVDALIALVPNQAHPFVGRHLQALERKQLIRPARSGGQELSFRHVLIQLAAYQSTTRADRARLHERFAEWLRDEAPERPPLLDEILGYHLGEALAERRALGMRGDRDDGLAVQAGEYLAAAGLRAAWRYDVAAAVNLLARAHALLPSTNPQRRTVMRRLAEVHQVVGRLSDADSVLAAMLVEAEAEEDESLAQVARLERARLTLFRGPDPTRLRSIREEAERALEVFRGSGDEAGLAVAGAWRPNRRDADGRRRHRTLRAQGESRSRRPSPFAGRLTRLSSTQETCHGGRRHALAKAVRTQGAGAATTPSPDGFSSERRGPLWQSAGLGTAGCRGWLGFGHAGQGRLGLGLGVGVGRPGLPPASGRFGRWWDLSCPDRGLLVDVLGAINPETDLLQDRLQVTVHPPKLLVGVPPQPLQAPGFALHRRTLPLRLLPPRLGRLPGLLQQVAGLLLGLRVECLGRLAGLLRDPGSLGANLLGFLAGGTLDLAGLRLGRLDDLGPLSLGSIDCLLGPLGRIQQQLLGRSAGLLDDVGHM
jgi:DNA-binding SARP family transcriptional activator